MNTTTFPLSVLSDLQKLVAEQTALLDTMDELFAEVSFPEDVPETFERGYELLGIAQRMTAQMAAALEQAEASSTETSR